ncbi:MAG: PH domain-containing protein [Ruthenibacterium sp.]
MEFAVSRRGGAVIGLWAILLCALVCVPFWGSAFLPTLAVFILGGMFLFLVATVHFSTCHVRCGAHHLTMRRGILYTVTRRVPLRFVTGCQILRSPLQRLTGTCILLLFASGSTTLVAGADFADAERLSAFLAHGKGAN